ncbi:MAG TPA: DMT family transporter [Noviherbaspirillum sp.]
MRKQRDGLAGFRTVALVATAMLAFAANSLLCRLALQQGSIDPASFASIRLVSGALALIVIAKVRTGHSLSSHADWISAVMLFAYIAFFSFAYLALSAGTGALILFGCVQLTMLGAGLRAGEMFDAIAWFGLALAFAGLVYLVSPGIEAPPLFGAASMAIAGVAWGVYSLRGRNVIDPLAATAGNFARAALPAIALNLAFISGSHISKGGFILAVASGAITSGAGYVVWYAALRHLSAMRAATVQLSVPLIAAIGGAVFLSETVTPRLTVAAFAILGGIALVLTRRGRSARS